MPMKRVQDPSRSSSAKKVKLDLTNTTVFEIPTREAKEDEEDVEDLEPIKRRKGGVKEDGYGSDEDDQGTDSDADTDEEQAKKKDEDGDDDMFGDENKKIKKQFMSSKDIEGQEWLDPDQSDEDKEKPQFESFNMDQELAEGDFTQSGVYVRKKDEHGIHDSWLQGVGKKEIKKAKEAHQIQLEKEMTLDQNETMRNPDRMLRSILEMLHPGESISSAIQRLGASSAKTPKWKKIKKSAKAAVVYTEDEILAHKVQLEELTSLVTELFASDADIYEMRYESIVLRLRAVKLINSSWISGMKLPPLSF